MDIRAASDEPRALSPSEQSQLVDVVRETLRTYLETEAQPNLDRFHLKRSGAAFVSLRNGSQLRGCIGSLDRDRRLVETVSECAVNAATRDPRFPPVTLDELPEIEFEVSVLGSFSEIQSAEEIEIGRHGLFISKEGRHGLLLPQVAVELGLTPREFLECLCQKAGLPPGAWKTQARIEVFTAQVLTSGGT